MFVYQGELNKSTTLSGGNLIIDVRQGTIAMLKAGLLFNYIISDKWVTDPGLRGTRCGCMHYSDV